MNDTPKLIGAYTIEREIGRGGMGVVYLAKDPRLDRHVAIKVLPDEVAQDPVRLARFEREARLLASLNHPHIGGIHGLEEADGQRFLVLEYLQGETLDARLNTGPLLPREAIHVCRQVAAALEAAHEAGIIHRDLKPANIMITDDDQVKVLDFGLAKDGGSASTDSSSGSGSGSGLSQSPTVAVGTTGVGVIMGTAGYMSPEQARGRAVDRRTDIWSFGALLYECLTGKQLFAGETVSDTIAKILEREPDWDALPKDTPDRVRELMRRCLEKKARERLRDIGDARIELEELESGKTSSISGVSAGVPAAEHQNKLRMAWGVAAVAVIAAIALAGVSFMRPASPTRGMAQLQVTMPPDLRLAAASEDAVMSPDGTLIVFPALDSVGTFQLYLREMNSLEIKPLPGAENASQPFWSPDSRHLGFFAAGKLKRYSLDDGQVEVLTDVNSSRGGSWGAQYIVYAGAQGPIFRLPLDGGSPEPATQVASDAGETAHRYPAFLPDGKHFMYAVLPALTGQCRVQVASVDNGRPIEILSAPGRPVYAEPGYLVWQRGRRLVAQKFDAGNLKLSGKPVAFATASFRSNSLGAPPISASRTGTFVQVTPDFPSTRLEWHDERGRVLEVLPLEDKFYVSPSLSPDGSQLAVCILESEEQSDLWLIDMERMTPTRLTFGPGSVNLPIWAPDGDRLFYVSDREGPTDLYVKSLSSPDQDKMLVESDAMFMNPMGWSPDGRYIIYTQSGEGTGIDLWVARVDGEKSEARPFLASPFNEANGSISKNGRWIAYESDESGRSEVYVTSFPEPGRKYRISTDGAFGPSWSFDGRRIHFGMPDTWLMAVDVEAGETFRVTGPARRTFKFPDNGLGISSSPRDARWLLTVRSGTPIDASLTVVTDWMSEVGE